MAKTHSGRSCRMAVEDTVFRPSNSQEKQEYVLQRVRITNETVTKRGIAKRGVGEEYNTIRYRKTRG